MYNLIKKILKEEVGVPSGIADSAKRLYLDLITRLKRKTITGNSNFNLLFKNKDGKYSFADFKNFENIKIEFEFEGYDTAENPSHSGILIMGMGHQGEARLNDLFDLVNVTNNTTTLSITLAIPTSISEITNKDVIKTLMDNQVMIVSSLAHELKHAYDAYKKPTEKLKNRASYSTYSSVRTGIHEVDEFIYFLYFITTIENLVRPSEIYSLMQQGNITREDFLNFISSNTTYQTLKKINNFSVNDMISTLKEKPEVLDIFISKNTNYDIPEDIDKKIELFFNILYVELSRNILSRAHSMLTNNFFESLFGVSEEKQKFLDAYETEILRFKNNPLRYFEFQEKKFKFVSEKMMKRLSKLYSLAKPNPIKLVNKDPMTFEMRMLESKPRNIKS
jgi:hypothetical protein